MTEAFVVSGVRTPIARYGGAADQAGEDDRSVAGQGGALRAERP